MENNHGKLKMLSIRAEAYFDTRTIELQILIKKCQNMTNNS